MGTFNIICIVSLCAVGTKTSSKDNWEHACLWRDNGCTRWWGGNWACV